MAGRRKIELSDIQFSDERLNRLAQLVRRIANEMQAVQRILEEGEAGQVLTKITDRDYEIDWAAAPGSSGTGEVNTGANVGSGAQVFRDKSGVTLNFRTLRGEGAVSITTDGDEVVITASATALEANALDALVVAGAF